MCSSDQEWNQTLNGWCIYYGRELEDIYLNRCKIFIQIFKYSFLSDILKKNSLKKLNFNLHEYYYVYEVLYSRLQSK